MKALTIGGATIDVIATINQAEAERLTMHNAQTSFLMIEEGKKGDAERIEDYIGGGALNTAVSLSRLGCEVATVVKLGRDNPAETILARLGEEHVRTDYVCRSDTELTGRAIFLNGEARNPTIFVARGANTVLKPEDCTGPWQEKWDLVHITPLSEGAAYCLEPVVAAAVKNGTFISINPGRKQIGRFWPVFQKILPQTDLLSINLIEAQVMAPWICGSSNIPQDGEALVNCIASTGVRHVSLTDGSRGSWLAVGGKAHFAAASKVRVKGTAGAGDAYASTLAWALATGDYSPEQAMSLALKNAASVVQQPDTLGGLLSKPALTK